jgi:two-component SAPR family response regulator
MFHIIEDELMVASILAQMIKLFGEEATIFLSPVEYLEYAKSPEYQRPTGIFTDLDMPGVNGYELMEKIYELHPETKFVIVSGRPDFENDDTERKLACQYLCKPFHPQDIQLIIHTLKACSNSQHSPAFECEKVNECSPYMTDHWSCPHIHEPQTGQDIFAMNGATV